MESLILLCVFIGYTNEVGEAFRSIVPKSVVWSSYVVACGYVLADTIHKGLHVYNVCFFAATKCLSIFSYTCK